MKPFGDKLTSSDVSRYLDGLDLRPSARSPLLDSYRDAAAVLAAISDVGGLKATTGESGEAALLLEGDLVSTPAERQLGGGFMLKHEVRTRALKRLGGRDAILKALAVNPAERQGPVQEKFEQYLRGEAEPLAQQSSEGLEQSLQAILWLEGLDLPGVPHPDDVRLALSRARLIRPFEKLAGANFRGRVDELDRLRRFVGIIAPESRRQKLAAAAATVASRLFDVKPKPALNLFGSGGIGKSALVARFFLEHIRLPDDQRVPFAYLDFDNPFLNINDLSTVAVAIMRQLSLQFPSVRPFEFKSDPKIASAVIADVLGMLSQSAQQPFLLVLDTFEEVQYGGESQAFPLWEMLDDLQTRWPFLRVLISGRAPVTSCKLGGQPPEPMELTGVDAEAAEAILHSAGVADPDLAKALVKQVGTVPLSLHLAAAVVSKEGGSVTKGVRNLQTSAYMLFSVGDAVIQGQLYGRILDHIHTDDVKRLAHPGLVLRRISADLILKVLKEPCKLKVSTLDEARKLYDELARETALVAEESSGWLSHRSDLRRTMLKLLVEKNPATADDIHKAAVRYYGGREEIGATAEELYHRLMLGQQPKDRAHEFRRRDVRESLSRSLAELPVTAQIFLSGLGYDIDAAVLGQATRQQHEQYVAAQIVDLLPHGLRATERADVLLQEAGHYRGSNSPLYLEEARTRFVQQRYEEVFVLTDEGLRYALEGHDQPRVLDLIALKSWTLEIAEHLGELEKALPHLQTYASRLNRKLYLAQWAAQSLRHKRHGSDSADVKEEWDVLDAFLGACGREDFQRIAPVLRGVFRPLTSVNRAHIKAVASQLMPPGWLPDLKASSKDTGDNSDELAVLADAIDRAIELWPNKLPYVVRETTEA